jgi:transcriptional regulator
MYIPKINSWNDDREIFEFMRRFSFATIVTGRNDMPVATHLPFLVSKVEDSIILYSHFARANDHWQALVEQTSLVIFSEPHAYISPSHYEKELNVPTWNYLSVHAYGKATLINDTGKLMELLDNTINNFEADYGKQWSSLPDQYRMNMIKGIVGFSMVVTELQAKKKISQNRSEVEKENIVHSLAKSEDTNARLISEYMKEGSNHNSAG